MSGLGSFKGTSLPALPSISGGLGAFSQPAGGTVSPGLPTLNTNTGTTSFQQMYSNHLGSAPVQNVEDMPDFDGGSDIGNIHKFMSSVRDYKAGSGIYSDPTIGPPIPSKGLGKVGDLSDLAKIYPYIQDYKHGKGIYKPRPAVWDNGYASGGLVSLGSAYRSGGAVEQQAEPHSPDIAPQSSPPDATADPETEKLYMGAMMALDPEYPMSEEDRSMIIETFIAEFGEDELVELEAELAARSSDGRSDSIPATLGGKPAALSEGEYVVPADAVSGLGQGSTEAGARRLDDLVRQTRAASAQNVGRPIGPSPMGKGIA